MKSRFFSRTVRVFGVAASMTLTAATAQAAITGGSASFAQLAGSSLPATVGQNLGNIDSKVFGFNESVLTLTSDLAVDGGVIKAGTRLQSHLVFFDPLTKGNSASGYVSFDHAILGFITSSTGLVASNSLFGLSSVSYGSSGAIGLEGQDAASVASGNDYRLNFSFRETAAKPIGDEIRVFTLAPVTTPVPEPSTYAMLSAGLLCIGAMTRRRIG